MTMTAARLLVVLFGVSLPYLVRLPFGLDWLAQYTDIDIAGWLFFGAFNALAWGAIVAISYRYKRPEALIVPCLLGFGFLAWAHAILDLRADAQAAIALIFIPVFALAPIAVGGLIGYFVDRRLGRSEEH